MTNDTKAEQTLQQLVGKFISWQPVVGKSISGMVQSVAVWKGNVIFQVLISGKLQRFEYDLPYFLDNTILLNGDTSRRNETNLRWLF